MNEWKLEKKTITKGTIVENFDVMGRRIKEMYKEDFPIEVLSKNGVVWMSDSKMERDTNRDFIQNARGDVLIAGLGMAWTIGQIQNKEEVTSITVVELDDSLIEFIKKEKDLNDKVKIIHQDIWKFLDEQRGQTTYDIIWLDIWEYICGDNLVDMIPMKFLSKQLLNEDGKVLVWCEEASIQSMGMMGGSINGKKLLKDELHRRGIKEDGTS